MKKLNESGALDLMLVAIIVAVLGIGGLAYWRIKESNKSTQTRSNGSDASEQIEALPNNLEGMKSLDEIEQIAGLSSGVDIISFVLESKDGGYEYKIITSDGRKLVINAATGAILSEESTDVSDDDKIPAGLEITVSPAQAYQIAAAKSSSQIKKIELEVEDKKVVYKVEFRDGSKVEIDATNGAVLKSEIKDESEDEDENEDESDEDGEDEEDQEDEDTDADEDDAIDDEEDR